METTILFSGVFDLPWWGYALAALGLTHITIVSVTVFLHRCQAHRALDLHPLASHFFRLWLWMTTGMVTKEWAAIHRKHHAKCETPEDPHSPQQVGINRVLWGGVFLYVKESYNGETMDRYGHGTPDDWLERNVYSRFAVLGITLMGAADRLDPVLGGGRYQRYRPLLGLPQLVHRGREHQHRAVGLVHRRRGAA